MLNDSFYLMDSIVTSTWLWQLCFLLLQMIHQSWIPYLLRQVDLLASNVHPKTKQNNEIYNEANKVFKKKD
jgi:hypothetical protein